MTKDEAREHAIQLLESVAYEDKIPLLVELIEHQSNRDVISPSRFIKKLCEQLLDQAPKE